MTKRYANNEQINSQNMALDNSNTCTGYKLVFYRYVCSIDMYCTINFSNITQYVPEIGNKECETLTE